MTLVSPAPEEDAKPSTLPVPLPADGSRVIIVAYPMHPCASSSSAVFVDEQGAFLGSVSAGTASMLRVPANARMIHSFSSTEVTAARGTWFSREDISLTKFPEAILVEPSRGGKNCGSGTPWVYVTSRASLEPRIGRLAWIETDGQRGHAWLDAHRARVNDVLEKTAPPADEVVTVTRYR